MAHRINKIAYIWIWMVCILALPQSSMALDNDQQQPLYLQADRVNIDHKIGRIDYFGHVKLSQGSSHLNAYKATNFTDQQNRLKEAIAYGHQQQRAHYWTIPSADKPVMHAYANKIQFFPERHVVFLIGNVTIQQGQMRYTAPWVEYDMKQERLISRPEPSGKTTIVIKPKNEQTRSKKFKQKI